MENLNNKIANILRQHPEGGEKFFDALDFMIRSDMEILDYFIKWAKIEIAKHRHSWGIPYRQKVGVVLSGSFGRAILSSRLKELMGLGDFTFSDLLVVNGGIRSDEPVEIYKTRADFKADYWVLLDDSFYSGKTARCIADAMRKANPFSNLVQALVIYDGSKDNQGLTSSLFRYYEQETTATSDSGVS